MDGDSGELMNRQVRYRGSGMRVMERTRKLIQGEG